MATRTKRGLDTDGDDPTQHQDKKPKTQDVTEEQPADTHEVRMLVDSRQVGSIIGRSGSNVTRIRREHSVFMSILKAPENVKERVMTIKGTSENIAAACRSVGEILIDVQKGLAAKSEEKQEGDPSNISMRFLVHQTLVGGIIGRGGTFVQATQRETGARVQVSQEALGQSTEKSVTISGSLEAFHAACLIVVGQIRDNVLRPGTTVVPFEPSAYLPISGGPGPGLPGGPSYPFHGYPPASQYGGGYGNPYPQPYPNTPYPPYSNGPQQGGGFSAARSGEAKQKIVIPTICAGNVIGRGGTIISRIRQQSGTHISIADPEPETPRERMVTITGTPQGIQTAVMLIRQVVEQFQAPQQEAPVY